MLSTRGRREISYCDVCDVLYLRCLLLVIPPLVKRPERHTFHHFASDILPHDGLQLVDDDGDDFVHSDLVQVLPWRKVTRGGHGGVEPWDEGQGPRGGTERNELVPLRWVKTVVRLLIAYGVGVR